MNSADSGSSEQLFHGDRQIADTLAGRVKHSIGDGRRRPRYADLADRLPAERAGIKIRLADRNDGHYPSPRASNARAITRDTRSTLKRFPLRGAAPSMARKLALRRLDRSHTPRGVRHAAQRDAQIVLLSAS